MFPTCRRHQTGNHLSGAPSLARCFFFKAQTSFNEPFQDASGTRLMFRSEATPMGMVMDGTVLEAGFYYPLIDRHSTT